MEVSSLDFTQKIESLSSKKGNTQCLESQIASPGTGQPPKPYCTYPCVALLNVVG